MADGKAKGDLFQNVLALVVKRWGKASIKAIGSSPDNFMPEEWYPFSLFCSLLTEIDNKLGKGDGSVLYRLGYDMMKGDFRWRTMFTGRDPKFVFISTKRQDTQYTGGKFKAELIGEKHIHIEMWDWACSHVWYEFYKGRIQGVLELTGYTGMIEMKQKNDVYGYGIKWQ